MTKTDIFYWIIISTVMTGRGPSRVPSAIMNYSILAVSQTDVGIVGFIWKKKFKLDNHLQTTTCIMPNTRDSYGARLCVNAAPICEKAHHFLPRVP